MYTSIPSTDYLSLKPAISHCTVYLSCAVCLFSSIYSSLNRPQRIITFIVQVLISLHYRLKVYGKDSFPESGGVLMLGNHTSWLDWAIMQLASPRRIRFVMDRGIYKRWYFRKILELFDVLPISTKASKATLQTIEKLLKDGEIVLVFPEGRITRNAQVGAFQRGFEMAVKNTDAKIVPFYLHGLWGSRFSYANPWYKKHSRYKMKRDVNVCFGKPMGKESTAPEVKKAVLQLSVHSWQHYTDSLRPVHLHWLNKTKKFKNKTCLLDVDGTAISHAQLLIRTIAFSHQIKKTVATQQDIGLLIPTGAEGIIANMAVMMLGKTAVNLNYTDTVPNLRQAVQKAEIQTIITSKHLMEKLRAGGQGLSGWFPESRLCFTEEMSEGLSEYSLRKIQLCVNIMPAYMLKLLYFKDTSIDATAAVLFSHGSQGEPKGVELTHRNIIGNIKQIAASLNYEEHDVALNIMPLFYAFGLTVTSLMPLLEGIPIVCHPDQTKINTMGRTVAKNRITLLFTTPTFLRLYTRNKRIHPLMFQTVRMVVSGAEKLQKEVRTAFKAKFGLNIYEGYGTTETTPVASVNLPDLLSPDDLFIQQGSREGTVGMPLPGCTFKIVDPETLEDRPTGETGLIFVGGPQIMRGYMNDEEKTTNVITNQDGIRWYKTGDTGKVDEDGFLTIEEMQPQFERLHRGLEKGRMLLTSLKESIKKYTR